MKIIAFLVRYLPQTLNYKVILMLRDLDEVLASQTKMLDQRGEGSDTDDVRMRKLFVDHLARTRSMLAHRPCFEALHIRYPDVLDDSVGQARRVSEFLGRDLDVRAMAAVVDPSLYRNRG